MIVFLALFACSGDTPDKPETVTNEPLDTGFGWPEDTDDPDFGTDEDQDGWSVEAGDCDDSDPYINPGREEELGDGIDNDCDGWIDEQLVGLTALQVGDGKTVPARIHEVDALGFEERVVELDDASRYPIWMSEGASGSGWVVSDYANIAVVEVDEMGRTTELAAWKDEQTWGLLTHPDGYYVVTTDTALYAVEPGTGTTTELARWTSFDDDGNFVDLYAVDVAYDSQNDAVIIFGYAGGLATVTPDGAFILLRPGSWETDLYIAYAGGYHDGTNTMYCAGYSATTGEYDIYTWDGIGWTMHVDWDDENQWTPYFMTVDVASDDFYLTANGATYPTIWQVDDTTGDTQLFYQSSFTGAAYDFWDIYARYDEGA